jgi:SAM-dependent methyltransferase
VFRLTRVKEALDNQFARDRFVSQQLSLLESEAVLLDAGCGSQRYRGLCDRFDYRGQDFGKYTGDSVASFTDALGGERGYEYGEIFYEGDICAVDERDAVFDAILCTEVFEHIPNPIEAEAEFARLLKPGGRLILTTPSNSLRHMDPYYFYTGFSNRWFEHVLSESGFKIIELEAVEDYYRWMAVEIARTAKAHSLLAKVLLAPTFLYFYGKKRTDISQASLCMGYHVVAQRV